MLILHMCVRLSQFGLHVFMGYQYIRSVASMYRHVVLSTQCPTFVILYALNYSDRHYHFSSALICLF